MSYGTSTCILLPASLLRAESCLQGGKEDPLQRQSKNQGKCVDKMKKRIRVKKYTKGHSCQFHILKTK